MPQVKQIGPSGQLAFGKKYAGQLVLVEQPEEGMWVVRCATAVPNSELPQQQVAPTFNPLENLEAAIRAQHDATVVDAPVGTNDVPA